MVAIIRSILALGTLVAAVTAASVAPRSSKITFTVYNKCKHEFAPIFSPALPGKSSWDVIPSGKSASFSFYSDTYRGKVFSPLRQANTTTGQGATQGEFDLATGDYDISVADGFNVGMYLQLLGRQYAGYCQAAICSSADCKDAYKNSSGLLSANRVGSRTTKPNHSCPVTFTTWNVQFC
ncbi:uncharacterized protein PAN0_011d4335 [Moesziomyces antarcticus]|uniref:Uncharacterized protein n=2 Tax=Pseudozyma antarctica TaxID=84753 RepID=A0A5C3FTM5_PSEA2|nr:uncharacterized protein PAN0_011d4335 [Moesziomyces antarcticus]GAK66113.1 conserved hypothetical protein [Moesziomyces antarcticus]SPO46891.1 uncharacterized protein PSANT_04577 [Moesziomyces antarcticus]